MSDVNFLITAQDFASRKFREVGRAARHMAEQVAAADALMEKKMQRMDHTVSAVLKGIIFAGPAAAAAMNAVTVAVGGLASALVSLGPGLGGLGLSTAFNISKLSNTRQQLDQLSAAVNSASTPAARKSALKALRQFRQENLTGSFGREFRTAGRLRDATESFGSMPAENRMMIQGMRTLMVLMQKLKPVTKEFANILGDAFRKLRGYLRGPEFAHFLEWAKKVGAINFKNLLSTLGNLGRFLIHIGEDFSGVGTKITGWLKRITGEWNKWATNLKGDNNFHRFVQQAEKDGPLLVRLFNALVKTLGRLSVGLGALGHLELKAFVWAMETLSKLPPGMLAALFAGFQIVSLANNFRKLATTMRDLALAQRLFNLAAKANPYVVIAAAVIALGTALYEAYKHSKTFRHAVQTAWNAVKTGAQAVWNWLKNNFVPFFTKTLPNAFRTVVDWLRNHWIDIVVTLLTGPIGLAVRKIVQHWDKVKQAFNAGLDVVRKVGGWLRDQFVNALNRVGNAFGDLWDSVKRVFDWMRTRVQDILKKVGGFFLGLADTAVKAMKTIFDQVTGTIRSILNVASKIPGPWQDGFRKARDAVDNFKRKADDSFNKVIDGIDHMKSKINSIPKKTETKAHFESQTALQRVRSFVQRTNQGLRNIHDEAVNVRVSTTVNGTAGAKYNVQVHAKGRGGGGKFAGGGPVTGPGGPTSDQVPAMLSNGEHVFTAEEVRRAGGHGRVAALRAAIMGRRMATGGPVASDPVSIIPKFNYQMLPFGALQRYVHDIGKQLGSNIGKQLKHTLASALSAHVPGGFGGSYGVGRWRGLALQVMAMLGIPASAIGIILHRIALESGGNPTIVNHWDSNAAAGHPSVGLAQVIGPTFQAYAGRFRNVGPFRYGSSINPMANLYAGLNYAMHRYGSSYLSVLAGGSGYRRGGFPPPGMPAWVGEAGPELVIPTGRSQVVPNSGPGHNAFIRELAAAIADALDGATMVVDHKNLPDAVAAGRQIQHALLSLKRSNGGKHLGLT